mmetsp:Transcript_17536/g.39753  ORF Transcript_17536/g.39753 Transcript_17536/m.39753 type:complete len:358 (-) Transcript_17536:96-1169(-)
MSATWFVEALAHSDGTLGGVATVLADRLPKMPHEQIPRWVKTKNKKELVEELTQALIETYECMSKVNKYVEEERAKGRDFEEVYAEVKPYIDEVSRPMHPEGGEELMNGEDRDNRLTQMENKLFNRDQQMSFLYENQRGQGEPAMGADGDFHDPNRFMMKGYMDDAVKQAKQASSPHRHLDMGLRNPAGALEDERDGRSHPPTDHLALTSAPALDPYSSAEGINVQEPLVLLGSINEWDEKRAQTFHRLSKCKSRDPSIQEHRLRVRVPEDGMEFVICSWDNPQGWRLFPGDGPMALREAVQDHVNTYLAVGTRSEVLSMSGDRRFEVRGTGMAGAVDIRVLLTQGDQPLVWFTEIA